MRCHKVVAGEIVYICRPRQKYGLGTGGVKAKIQLTELELGTKGDGYQLAVDKGALPGHDS